MYKIPALGDLKNAKLQEIDATGLAAAPGLSIC
jgi:hypothetical protein